MPKVPEYNHKRLKTIYNPMYGSAPASMKQKNYILILCERRKLPVPDMTALTRAQAAQLISEMTN